MPTINEESIPMIKPVIPPQQFDEPQDNFDFLIEVTEFMWVHAAREAFLVDGKGLTAAVLDTGLNVEHIDFKGKVVTQVNCTNNNGGKADDAADGNGHGTNVGGIICAKGDHTGIAPGANVIPIKVLNNDGSGSFAAIEKGLQWVLDNHREFNISVVCMSLGDGQNYVNDTFSPTIYKRIANLITTLVRLRVAVVVAAGNDYFTHGSEPGMSFPGIVRRAISVGAIYDADDKNKKYNYNSGAKAFAVKAGQLTPFSQRLHTSVNRWTATKVFAPGAPVISSGINGLHGESVQQGTSQAAPATAGVLLLMQEFYLRETGQLPSVYYLTNWLRNGGLPIYDGDDENDNVQHTKLDYVRIDALSAVDAVRRYLIEKKVRDSKRATGT